MKEITQNELNSPEAPGDGWYIIEAAGQYPHGEIMQNFTPEVLALVAAVIWLRASSGRRRGCLNQPLIRLRSLVTGRNSEAGKSILGQVQSLKENLNKGIKPSQEIILIGEPN